MSSSAIENVKIGVCTVLYDGEDLGYTKGGVSVSVTTSKYTKKVDQFGETPIGDVITGRTVTAKVPLAEATVFNLYRTMPGSTITVTGGTKASGTVTFSTAAPADGDKVTIDGVDFTFKTSPTLSNPHEMAIPATVSAAATALAAAVNASTDVDCSASALSAVVTLTADDYGTSYNSLTLAKTFATAANCTLSGATLSGGTAVTSAKVSVPAAVGTDLINISKTLILRPRGATGNTEDFVIYKAATAGGLEFSYSNDNERIFNIEFNGYPDQSRNDLIFSYGN